jgi:FkbM family methyltransferase
MLDVLAALAAAAAFVVVAFYLRRSAHYQDALERQLSSLGEKLDTVRDDARRRDEARKADRAMLAALEDRLEALQAGQRDLGAAQERHATEVASTRKRFDAGIEDARAVIAGLSDETAKLTCEVRSLLRSGYPPSDVVSRLKCKSSEELLALASSLAVLRPLVPYPAWRFDADLCNPDLAFQTRHAVWDELRVSGGAELEVDWHGGLRLRLQMGNDSSRQIFIAGCLDPNEFAFLDRMLEPGMTVIDAGANEGVYSVFAARKVGPEGTVWAFEPSPREMVRLRDNLSLNGLTARLFSCALADIAGGAEFQLAEAEHAGQNTLGGFAYAGMGGAGALRVELQRLDDIVAREGLERLDLLKADVEGAELRLFRGAEATLRRLRPLLLFEASEDSLRHQGASRHDLLGYLGGLGYQAWIFDSRTGLPAKAPVGVFADNMLAIPKERGMDPRWLQYWRE